MLYKTCIREASLYSHVVCKYIEYIYPFSSALFFLKNQEINIIQWIYCSGQNALQALKTKEKISVKNTRLFLKQIISFAFKCCSEAVVLINLVRNFGTYGFLMQYVSIHLFVNCD